MPQIYIIGGPNGAGKTTSAMSLLPDLLECQEYINADAIAAALSPFAPETTAIQAGKLMLDRIHTLAQQRQDFAFESTLASRSFAPFLKQCQKQGYEVNLIYLWLQSPELAVARVLDRVQNGGHNIPTDVVHRRYKRSLVNLFNLYLPLADNWILYDNTKGKTVEVAQKGKGNQTVVYDSEIWQTINEASI